ncbi:helix-turn-helix domain-containing protein [Alkalihalobacillus oceani]|uniref:helix-turn-helix domain-containing protein n=1 Tax=Halalkalibacter oceani TaxID=1653776 RepID=UPI00203C785A|nr:helix-turn-helix transcriptional regulator [Halalkalibacter oceani]MCM3761615.1 helix-turn-helix domain-containing protein [Halalkalibacter oceani]
MSLAKKARKKMGYSLDQAAQKIGISAGYLSQIENGQRHISADRAGQIAHIYNSECEEIFVATRFARREK